MGGTHRSDEIRWELLATNAPRAGSSLDGVRQATACRVSWPADPLTPSWPTRSCRPRLHAKPLYHADDTAIVGIATQPAPAGQERSSVLTSADTGHASQLPTNRTTKRSDVSRPDDRIPRPTQRTRRGQIPADAGP